MCGSTGILLQNLPSGCWFSKNTRLPKNNFTCFQLKSPPESARAFVSPPERLPRRAVRGAGAHSPRFVQLLSRQSLPRCGGEVPRRFCLSARLRGAERRCGSFSDPQRRAAGWVGAMWRRFAPARATIPPPHSTLEDRLSHYDGGAQDIISTGSNHRRRNRSPAWLLAPRSAQRSRR